MKKRNLILPSICFAVLSTPAFEKVIYAAENDTPITEVSQINETQYVKVDPGSHLNLRTGASSSASILVKLANGTQVTVFSVDNGWAKVKANGKYGFVSSKFLAASKPDSSSPATPAKTDTSTQYVKVNPGSSLILRTSASTSASVLSKLANGTQVTVFSVENGWAKVKANGKNGFVSSKFLVASKPGSSSSATPDKPAKTEATTQFVKVNPGSSLNLRTSASTSASVLSKLANGTKVTVLSVENGWAKVTANGRSGFVSSKFLAASKPGSESSSTPAKTETYTQYVKVNPGSNLNLRSNASTSASVLAKLANGNQVTVYSVENGWAKVKANGKIGFVSSKFLTASKPGSESSTTPAKTETTTQYVKVNPGSHLNLRSSASASSSVLSKLANRTQVTVYSVDNGWAKVKVNGKYGFVSSKFLTASKPGSSSSSKPETTIQFVDVNPGSSLNMRNRPSTNGSIIIKLARGAEVTVISEEKGWAKIKAYGQEGYVSSEYLTSKKSDSNPDTESKPAPENNTSDQHNPESESGKNHDIDNSETEHENKPDAGTTLKYVNVNKGSNLNMRSEPSTNSAIVTKLSFGTVVTVYSEKNGWSRVTANGQTGYVSTQYLTTKTEDPTDTSNHKINMVYEKYETTLDELTKIQMQAKPQTDKKYTTYIREDAIHLNNPTSGTVQGSGWNLRGGAGTNHWVVGKVNAGENLQIVSKTKGSDGYTWYAVNYNKTWVNASPDEVKYYLDPKNSLNDPVTSFQFLKLSETTSLDQFEVNERILAGKGVLKGHAATFITASEKYGVNDMYLISHALLETGNGTSKLAQGVEVYGKTVYNMFGIGAYDGSALTSGANFAYNAGWFTPEAAIMGGAKFIAQGYINSGQDTLYKMRWNPQAAAASGVATHQYATDIGWATKQVKQIYNLYSLLDTYKVTLEIPTYKQ